MTGQSHLMPLVVLALSALAMPLMCQAVAPTEATITARAQFTTSEFQGTIDASVSGTDFTFSPTLTAVPTDLTTAMYRLVIYSFPVKAGSSSNQCEGAGPVFNPTSAAPALGNLTTSGGVARITGANADITVARNGLGFFTTSSGILGRTLAIVKDDAIVACANLEQHKSSELPCRYSGREVVATFDARNGNVGGEVIVRRAPFDTTDGIYYIYSNLFYTTTKTASTSGHFWAFRKTGSTDDACKLPLQSGSVLEAVTSTRLPISNSSGDDGRFFMAVAAPGAGGDGIAICDELAIYNENSGDASGNPLSTASAKHPPRVTFRAEASTSSHIVMTQDGQFSGVHITLTQASTTLEFRIKSWRSSMAAPSCNGTGNDFQGGDVQTRTGVSGDSGPVCDSGVTLRGLNSIANRAVAFQKAGADPQCYPLTEMQDSSITLHEAKAEFSGSVTGTIYLRQSEYASGGTFSDVTIHSTGLRATTASTGHNMHVHVNRTSYQNDATACTAPGPHYDPFSVNMKGASAATYSQCSQQQPLRCEVGDTSRKTGQFPINRSPFLRQDSNLFLNGMWTSVGRSFVIHVKDGGAPRLACANIVPMDAAIFQIRFPVSQLGDTAFSTSAFRAAVMAGLLQAGTVTGATLAADSYIDTYTDEGVMYIRGWFTGMNAAAARDAILASESLGRFKNTPASAAAISQVSISTLLVASLFSLSMF